MTWRGASAAPSVDRFDISNCRGSFGSTAAFDSIVYAGRNGVWRPRQWRRRRDEVAVELLHDQGLALQFLDQHQSLVFMHVTPSMSI